MALSVPVTTKITTTGGNARLDYAMSAMQGYHENMEDAHAAVLNLDAGTTASFFGVYDGHGGPAVAKYCAKHLHNELCRHHAFRSNLCAALQDTFLRMDVMMRDRSAGRELSEYGGNDFWKNYRKALRKSRFLPICGQKPPYEGPVMDGCTACVVLIRGNRIFVGNSGDSRCVLSRNNQAIDLSIDHKPYLPAERQRIEGAGHTVVVNEDRGNIARVDDGIAISRSLGDLMYKDNPRLSARDQALTALPDVCDDDITVGAQFLVIACDGVWDCMESQQVIDFISIYLSSDVPLGHICEALLGHCLQQPKGRFGSGCPSKTDSPTRWRQSSQSSNLPGSLTRRCRQQGQGQGCRVVRWRQAQRGHLC